MNTELFNNAYIVGPLLYRSLESQGQKLLTSEQPETEKMTVAVRTLNEARTLPALLDTIEAQYRGADTQIVVLDSNSTDGTVNIAKSYGAKVLFMDRDNFTYPKSWNVCMRAADNPLVFLTAGHAALASNVALEAAKRDFTDPDVAGVFAPRLPGAAASRTEKLAAIGNAFVNRERKDIKKASMGVLGTTNAAIRKEAWADLGGFDERYEKGGEDTELAARMLNTGLKIVRNPLVAVHHSHGLGPVNYTRQMLHWSKVLKGDTSKFDRQALQRRRPDLDFS